MFVTKQGLKLHHHSCIFTLGKPALARCYTFSAPTDVNREQPHVAGQGLNLSCADTQHIAGTCYQHSYELRIQVLLQTRVHVLQRKELSPMQSKTALLTGVTKTGPACL